MLPPRAVEIWSYLIGLGPVGRSVGASNRQICDDLGIRLPNQVSQLITKLTNYGAIRKDGIGVYTVLKRIGHEGAPRQKRPRFELGIKHFERPEWGPKRAERLARLSEIPDDTRDMTARLFGDPLPNDPRRPWQGAHV